MKTWIASVMAFTDFLSGTKVYAYEPAGLGYVHACDVIWKATGELLPATCGLKVDPNDQVLREYRTFTYDGLVYEEYRIQEPGREDRIHQIVLRPDGEIADNSLAESPSKESNVVANTLVVGGAVLAAGTAIFGLHQLYRSASPRKSKPFAKRSRTRKAGSPGPYSDGTDIVTDPNSYMYSAESTACRASPEESAPTPSHDHSSVVRDEVIHPHESPVTGDWGTSHHEHETWDHGATWDHTHGH